MLWRPKMRSSHFVPSNPFENIALVGQSAVAYLSWDGERRGSDSSWLILPPVTYTHTQRIQLLSTGTHPETGVTLHPMADLFAGFV